jgi:ribosomal protein S18 acetylase RimI-like enzyme
MRRADTAPTLRTASGGDAAAIVALVESAYRGESSRQGWTTEAALLEGQRTDVAAIGDAITSPNTRVIVATDVEGQLVGCCAVERVDGERAYFGTFAVQPQLQGAGLGKRLLAEAERCARQDWGCAAIELQVIAQRAELIEWYERHGYERTGESKPFPYGDERFGVPVRDDLYFVVLAKSLGTSLPVGGVPAGGGAGASEPGASVVPAPGESSGPAR